MELLEWIDIEKLDWELLSENPNKNKKAFAFLFHNNKKTNVFFLECNFLVRSKSR